MDLKKTSNKFFKLLNNPIPESIKIINFIIENMNNNFCKIFKIKSFFRVYEGHDKLLKYLNYKKRGFFIECGGNNGKDFDPTYYLEKIMNWTGIIVEPLPIYKECFRTRKKSKIYNYALVANDFSKESITIMDCNMMSIIKGVNGYEDWIKSGEKVQKIKAKEIIVPAITLNKILEDYYLSNKIKVIDLLVIDTELYEINVLKGFDLNKYKPNMILIEIQSQELGKMIDNYLGLKYKFISKIGYKDYLYQLIDSI